MKWSPLLEATLAVSSKSQKSVVTAKSSTAAATNSSLTLLNGLPPVKVLTDDSTPPPPPPAAAAAAPSPVDVLTAALTQAGVDTRGMQFQEHTDVVTYPGGSYTNHLITMTAGGKTQDYMADLMMINPHVTVVEIQQLLAGNRHGIG